MNKLILFVFSIFLTWNVLAEEKAAPAAAPAAPVATLPPWIAIEAKIQELSSRIKSKEESMRKLLEEKNHLSENSPHVKETLKQILKEHGELKSMAEEYQKNVSMLNYRFPERNAKSGRSYDRIEVKSVSEMEQAMGMDGKLNRNLQKMRTQYGSAPKQVSKEPKAPAPVKKTVSPAAPSIEDEGAIIINK